MMTEQRAISLVSSDVYLNLSTLVATLADGPAYVNRGATDLRNLCRQASALTEPVDDYEEAAIQAGWIFRTTYAGSLSDPGCLNAVRQVGDEIRMEYGNKGESADVMARRFGLVPIQREVFEHWSVSAMLADKLEAKGEKIDRDFAGLIVWARTISGQNIALDRVIMEIAAEA